MNILHLDKKKYKNMIEIKLFENFDEWDPFSEETYFPSIKELIKKQNSGEELTDDERGRVIKYLYDNDLGFKKITDDLMDKVMDEHNRRIKKNENLSESVKFNKQTKKKDAKTDVYNVTKSGTVIGQVKWSSRMRGYAFLPTKESETEIKEFIKNLQAKRKAEKKKTSK